MTIGTEESRDMIILDVSENKETGITKTFN